MSTAHRLVDHDVGLDVGPQYIRPRNIKKNRYLMEIMAEEESAMFMSLLVSPRLSYI